MPAVSRLPPLLLCCLVAAGGLAAAGTAVPVPLDGETLWKLVSIGGGTAVLGFIVYALMTGLLFTKGAMAAKDVELAKLAAQLAKSEGEKEFYRERAYQAHGDAARGTDLAQQTTALAERIVTAMQAAQAQSAP